MASPGLLDWANSIRLQISNDSAKHIFQEQIQQLGFNFLEARLDTVMAGPKKDNILELIKTPGRKKAAASSKARAASKLKNTVTYSLEDDDTLKENVAPFNTFHQTLLQAKSKKVDEAAYDDSRDPFRGQPIEQPIVEQVEIVVVSSPVREPEHEELPSHSADSDTLAAPRSEQNELSVIAEDDESAERSRMSIQLPRSDLVTAATDSQPEEDIETVATTAPSSPVTHKTQSLTTTSSKDIFYSLSAVSSKETFDITPASSSDTFHSIPLDSPAAVQPVVTESPQAPEPALPPHSDSPVVAQPPVLRSTRSTPKPDPESLTAPLPEIPPWHPPNTHHNESVSVSLPPPPANTPKAAPNDLIEDIVVPIHDPTTPGLGLTRKASVPNLPGPMMPMRKSMRTPRDPSMGLGPTVSMASVLGSATPGAAITGGKRTSWLMKAREVKAMEDTGKKANTFALNVPGMSSGGNNKRKSGEMLGEVPTSQTEEEDSDRSHKSAKIDGTDLAPFKPTSKSLEKDREENVAARPVSSSSQQPVKDVSTTQGAAEVGVLDRFKKTVEGFGVRFGKSTGKSLGGPAAASALAEARAAAEARIGQRNKDKEELTSGAQELAVMVAATVEQNAFPPPPKDTQVDVPVRQTTTRSSDPVKKAESRLSVSDLVAAYDRGSNGAKEREKPFQFLPPSQKLLQQDACDTSTSTTPPNSPPPPSRPTQFAPPPGPVFNKPTRVFVPPPPATKDFALPPSTSTVFSKPPPTAMGLPLHIPAPSPSDFQKRTMPLSAQSTLESVASGSLFDDDVPAWMPRTQDTEYSTAPLTQSQSQAQRLSELDEDDSWPLDEKLSPSVQWAFGVSKEDSMTWSSLPTQSQRGSSGPVNREPAQEQEPESQEEMSKGSRAIPGAFNMDVDDDEVYEEEDGLVVSESDFEGLADNGQSTVSLVPKPVLRSNSQLSMASSSSSNTGFLGHASKLVNSVLGTSKKGKTEVKSLQLAAMAAKKQQEEKDKKAARLKEMEHRRQLALQRKADEEKAKALEEERRIKEDGERRKREREEHTDKRPLKGATKKEDDNTKKRKIEPEKKQEIKKPSSKVGKPSAMKSGMKQPVVMTSSTAYNASHQTAGASSSTTAVKAADAKPSKMPTAKGKGKAPTPKAPIDDDDITQPSQIVQTQMAARAKAQLQAANANAKVVEPQVASESIELPDINSEYSDSDDEDRPRTFDPPEWAQSPELRQALQMQSTINPDEIFGEIRPLRMEELFRTRTSRFRARTSSANWAGSDRLTVEEERDYARRMGFR